MRSSNLPWRMDAAVLFLFLLHFFSVLAGSSVNVALKTSFSAGPYLLELLETAAEENSTSYFPLLDRIAEGTFGDLGTDEELFNRFVEILQQDGHIRDLEVLSSFQFALALRSAAPRIEAHYQYYNTSIGSERKAAQDAACPVWVHFDDKQYCSPGLERAQQDFPMGDSVDELPFDRILGDDTEKPASILYADITHPLFRQFHEVVSKTAKEGKSSYRLRYRPPLAEAQRPLYLNGYGVELVLKRTDYIVIDDREAANSRESNVAQLVDEDTVDESVADLKPLTTSELSKIGLNAASFVMGSSEPLDTLLKVSLNFPRYSSLLASQNASVEFLTEFKSNRELFLPQGYNILWINGVQVDARQISAFAILDHLRHERRLINQLRAIGLTGSEAIDLLSHQAIAQAQVDDDPQRYDWRDESEGGKIIMWLNDIEKDKRYEGWPTRLTSLLQRTYPGQLPPVRRDVHNLIIPMNMADSKDLELIVGTLQNFVKRTIPIRFGLVPTFQSPGSVMQTKLAYHILDTYGLAALLSYFEGLLSSKKFASASKSSFTAATAERKIRHDQSVLTYEAVLESDELSSRLEEVEKYLDRLALNGERPPFLINGVALPRSDNWLESMSGRVTSDLRSVQRGVMEEVIPEETWVPNYFLFQSAVRRNALIVPEDPKSIKVLDIGRILDTYSETFCHLPRLSAVESQSQSIWAHLFIVADLDSEGGEQLLLEAIAAQSLHPQIELLILHNPAPSAPSSGLSLKVFDIFQTRKDLAPEEFSKALADYSLPPALDSAKLTERSTEYWRSTQSIAEMLGLASGENGLWLNGRVVGPVAGAALTVTDFEHLLTFERSKRILPVTMAIEDLGLTAKFRTRLDLAKVTSLVARAHTSDVPEGIFESPPLIRVDKFNVWNGTHSSVHISNTHDPTIRIVASLDPAAEIAQRWLPILKTMSELEGIDLKIFLNPKEKTVELPVKRFYRQVLESKPIFNSDGLLRIPRATFTGIPADALLNLGMDVPDSWLVAPQECSYDLDNIKLSTLPAGQNVDATYELEHILIEGHSRDVTTGPPPRGVQLLLGTEKTPHFADTIVMANLGYFQFKSNPGYWHISLQPGRSSKIFTIDSVGAKGYAPQPGDLTTAVALLSFQGTTLFPRLSRNPGMEAEDVLESSAKPGSAMDYLNRGASFASSALSSVGLSKSSSGTNADINIFSVASGHLYERMLNIMILSVMKNTKYTVKFWFIEQFLSPSFKSFLPDLSAHYGFQYEMVTYKWPHWLRPQKEKQREIWGYKILFLDVLFPTSLDKVIFVDADQIVRTDMMELNKVNLHGAPYGFTPMCDSRTEMEGFRFWKQGYWKTFLQGKPYHISALYVVDLKKFRELAAGDRLRQQYHALSADPASLSNLDQDLPNHMQHNLPIFSLSQEWLWCETWCSDASLEKAKTIDLCNNPLTKEPKLDRARRQVPEWTLYDEEIAKLARQVTVDDEIARESLTRPDLGHNEL